MGLSDDDVREILRIVDESDVAQLSIETDGFSLHVSRGDAPPPARPPARSPMAAPDPPTPAEPAPDQDTVIVPSPMLGTFYRAEAPGAAPFVEVGATVEPDSTVCIIEVMKMMNSVHAGVAGTIAEVCVENGEPVEYGARLFRVEP